MIEFGFDDIIIMGMFVCTQEVMDLEEYGYVRVSAVDQNEARQMLEMKKLGIKSKKYLHG